MFLWTIPIECNDNNDTTNNDSIAIKNKSIDHMLAKSTQSSKDLKDDFTFTGIIDNNFTSCCKYDSAFME